MSRQQLLYNDIIAYYKYKHTISFGVVLFSFIFVGYQNMTYGYYSRFEARELAQFGISVATLLEDLSLILSTHMLTHNHLWLQFHNTEHCVTAWVSTVLLWCALARRHSTHIHKSLKFKKKNPRKKKLKVDMFGIHI